MKLLVTTNGHVYRNNKHYYTPIVYNYVFFQRYLSIFEEVRLVAHVSDIDEEIAKTMQRVDGPNLELFEIVEPRGKWEYIKKYLKIKRQLKQCYEGCDAAVLRVPDQLAFQVFDAIKGKIPCGVEVTSNSWEFFAPGGYKGFMRPFLRRLWDYKQKQVCRLADATSYVTKWAIQKRYPPKPSAIQNEGLKQLESFTTHYSDVDVDSYLTSCTPRIYTPKQIWRIIHVSGSIGGRAKGHKELIESLVYLKERGYDVECVLVGAGQLDSDIQHLVDTSHLKVHFAGRQNAQGIQTLFLSSDLFVFPSYREGLPRVVVEAMASGIMCICTELDGIKELLPQEVLVPVQDSLALGRKIEYYLMNTELMTEQSRKNFDEAQNYSQAVLIERRNSFYQFIKNKANKE